VASFVPTQPSREIRDLRAQRSSNSARDRPPCGKLLSNLRGLHYEFGLVLVFCPLRPSHQTPHAQDEIYFIIRGRGVLIHDSKRDRFQSGDLLFVAAGIEHQFEDITQDLARWRVFYGPHGGEVPA
jgi:mannose-6-phosphate isomerase-like protein (cupin superfamily)